MSEINKWKWPELPGYIENRNGTAVSRMRYEGNFYRRSHRMPFHNSNQKTIKKLHRKFVESVVRGEYRSKRDLKKKPDNISDVINEFFNANQPSITPSVEDHYRRAFAYYLDRPEIPVDYDIILRHITLRQHEPPDQRFPLAESTRMKYLRNLRRFFKWCVDREYLHRNPGELLALPRPPSRQVEIFTPGEIDALEKYHRERSANHRDRRYAWMHLQHALLIRLGFLTGMRVGEMLRGRLEDIEEDHIRIWGKAAPRGETASRGRRYRDVRACRDEHARIRLFPRLRDLPGALGDWQEQLESALAEIADCADRQDGWFFPFQNTQTIADSIREARRTVGIDKALTPRSLRPSARWYYETVLRLDPVTIADLLGHEVETSLRYYRATPSVRDIAERVRGGTGSNQG